MFHKIFSLLKKHVLRQILSLVVLLPIIALLEGLTQHVFQIDVIHEELYIRERLLLVGIAYLLSIAAVYEISDQIKRAKPNEEEDRY